MADLWTMDLQDLKQHIEEAKDVLNQRRQREAEEWRQKIEAEAELFGYKVVPKDEDKPHPTARRARARLTPEDKAEMKKLREQGESARSIAERYGCSQATVYQATS